MNKYNLASGYSSHLPSTETSPGLTALVDKATRNGGHVFFGEPHVDGMVLKQYELLANNPDAFKAAAQNGVKHLALEFPTVLQSYADDFTTGKIDREKFKGELDRFSTPWVEGDAREAFMENFTRTIENAKQAGMKVHFADSTWKEMQNLSTPESEALEAKMLEAYKEEKPDKSIQEFAADFVSRMPAEERESLLKGLKERQEELQIKRLDDSEQYAYLRQRIPMGEAMMGVVGLKHLDNHLDTKMGVKTRGIDDYLEEEGARVTCIEVHSQRTLDYFREEYDLNRAAKKDPPDYTIILDDKRILDRAGNDAGRLDRPLENPVQPPRRDNLSQAPALPAMA